MKGLPCGVALGVFLACGGSQKEARIAKSEPSIAVLEPGAEPRRRLRYEPVLHAVERSEMSLKLRVATAFTNTVLEKGRQSVDFPTLKITERVEATGVTAAGDTVVTKEIEDVAVLDDVVDPTIRGPFERKMAVLKGNRTTWHLSPSGTRSDTVFDGPSESRAMRNRRSKLSDSIRDSLGMFPEAEIGIGAIWQVTSRDSSEGVTWDLTTTYRLRDLAESTAFVDATVVMRAPPQALSVEPNATTKLTSGTFSGSADLMIPLRGLVATSTAQLTGEANFSIVRGRLRITSTVRTEMLFSIGPLAPATTGNAP